MVFFVCLFVFSPHVKQFIETKANSGGYTITKNVIVSKTLHVS